MNPAPRFDAIDHLHVFVKDRRAAETWYGRVLGLHRLEALAHWATPQGPLTLGDPADQLHIALFQRNECANRNTIALRVSAKGFQAWQSHLDEVLEAKAQLVKHGGDAASLYFDDPDGNPYEITCYEMGALQALGVLA
jgi:catechol 2,3-dioxygenase-like lactoylglutathione lyase family enzyme